MFAPGVPDVMKEFNETSATTVTFLVSIYILGFAFGPLAVAPLSEIYGRRPLYSWGNILFVIFTVCTALSKNIGMFIAFRLLMGISGAVPVTIGSGSIADVLPVEKCGRAMSAWAMVAIVYGILYLLITTFSFVYARQNGFSEGDTGLTFLPAGLGKLIGVIMFSALRDKIVKYNKDKGNTHKPEIQITPVLTIPSGIALPVDLFIYGWTAEYTVHWIVPMIGVLIFSTGLMGVMFNVQNYLLDTVLATRPRAVTTTQLGRLARSPVPSRAKAWSLTRSQYAILPAHKSRYSTSSEATAPASRNPPITPEKPDYLSPAESEIWDKLAAEFSPTELMVQDVSGGCGSMYGIEIASEKFRGVNMLKQQRMVNAVLGDQMKGWHGVQLRTKVPS
ncbi:hypothetical protein DL765_010418 [Monosporascus sp. GIB2]|nr:hypothetical protein DL765_010418 [Monosporascus sp. GIB2]